ncbi:MAG: 4-alpha-glucanotransferase, partial [Selenomonadales bacterium]|nr:4-alpha-glucanotransferase [Selenomonadales bacterium]
LGKLVPMGLLTAKEAQEAVDKEGKLSLIEATENKKRLLRRAFNSDAWQEMAKGEDWHLFCTEEAVWLDDYALYMALKDAFGGKAWTAWDADIRDRKPTALAKWREKLAAEIDYYRFEQYLFERQWQELRMQARRFAVKIIGDLPIFVAHNSADVWANPHLFELDEAGKPTAVAGVPPDYFSEEGQLWGNPLYRWDVMKKDNYAWWTMRMKRTLAQVDLVRLDHFRGFEAYWRVDADEKTAINGAWVKGPAEDLFAALEKACGKLPVIAEDLGTITDEVNELRMKLGLPGMKILHFDLDAQSEVPLRTAKNSVLYTGTHDNNTTVGWLTEDLAPRDRDAVRKALMRAVGSETSDARLAIRFAYASNADTVIVPMQDVLELGGKARMNLPGTIEGNWSWRMPKGSLTEERAAFLRGLTKEYDR